MRTILFWASCLQLLLVVPCLVAQESNATSPATPLPDSLQLPLYVGCNQAELSHPERLQCTRDLIALQIFSTIQWPEQPLSNRGFIKVKVQIDSSGKMQECTIVEGLHALLDDAVMQAMSSLSDFEWSPIPQNGEPAAATFYLSIKYNPDEYGDNMVVFENQPMEIKKEKPLIFKTPENVPSFPDGQAALLRFMAQNLELPKWWPDSTIEGMVVVQFLIEKDGSIHDIKVVKGLQPEIDACCIKLVQKMPKWQPGRSRGPQLPCLYTLPIRIKLE